MALNPSQQWIEEWYANAPYGLRARLDSWPHRLKMLLEASDSTLASAVRQAAVVSWLPRPPFDGAKMLDVGCSSGDLMAHAARLGWRPTGCEASEASCAVARSRGFECYTGDWQANLPINEYDLVTLSHVLEHLPSPGATLASLRQSMTASAVMLCTVPNWDSAMARTFGAEWWANNPPEHIWLLRPRDTVAALERAGFRIEGIRLRSKWITLAELMVPGRGVMASQWRESRGCGSSAARFARRYVGTLTRALDAALRDEPLRSALTYCAVARPEPVESSGPDRREG